MVRPARDPKNPRNQRVPVMLSVGELAAVRRLAGERSVSDWIGDIVRLGIAGEVSAIETAGRRRPAG